MKQFEIYEGHMYDLRKKVQKIQNKCRKYGCDFHFAEVGEVIKEVKDLDGNLIKCNFIICEAEGTAKVNDWEFVASVEHTAEGNIFSKALTSLEIPERYRNGDSYCEHCNTHRSRKNTFIIHNTVTDEFKQVGKSCLMDFTLGMSVESATFFASLKDVFSEAQEAPVGCGWSRQYFSTDEVLSFTAETIRHFGYAKSDSKDSTRDLMENFLMIAHGRTHWFDEKILEELKSKMERVGFNPDSEEAQTMVQDAKAWVADQEASNDYMHNLKVACSNEFSHWGRFGLLVSLFPTYDRELEKEAQRREELKKGKMSDFVGQVGDRISFQIADVKCITSWESCFNGYSNTTTYVWKITDTEGNQFTWKTSNWLGDDDLGKIMKGTVKEHKTFREVKQTELTRCKIQGIA